MARKGSHKGMHIKRNTQGSSNEISFSVLDAAKEALEGRERESAHGAGGVSLFTLGKGKKPRSTPVKDKHIVLSSDAAPAHRSSHRAATSAAAVPRPSRALLKVVPVVVGICVIVALALVGLQTWLQLSAQQETLQERLTGQISLINEADNVVIPLDDLVIKASDDNLFAEGSNADPSLTSSALTEAYRAVVPDITAARNNLESVIAAVEDIQASLSTNEDEEAASQAIIAAQSRLNMLDAGVKTIDGALMATGAFELASEGWNKVIDGDAAARQATALLKDMSKDNVRASMEQSNKAVSSFTEAADLISQAQASYPGLNLEEVSTYLDKRLEAQQAALAADQAYLDRDKKALKKKNDQYNKLEEEAADLAKNFQGDPTQRVVERYQEFLPELQESYEAERLKAGNADAFLRDYLGSPA